MKPHDTETETACLASVATLAAIDTDKARAVLDGSRVLAEDFAGRHHSALWSVLDAMVREGRPPDLFALVPKCPGVPRELLAAVFTATDAGSPAERLRAVREAGQRRRVKSALETALRLVSDESSPLAAGAAEARKALESVGQDDGAETLDAAVFPLLDVLDEVQRGVRLPVLPTGLEALDSVIGGLQPAVLTVVGALPGVGKSALLAALVRNLARGGHRVGFFSLEDVRDWLLRRVVSEAAGVPVFVLANRKLGAHQMERVADAAGKAHVELRNVVVDDRPGLTAAEVVASARSMLARHQVKALFVDHLGEVRLERTDRHDLDVLEALQQLRALAKSYRIPVVVACHLRRREGLTPEAEPRLTDFAFSAAVERVARVALGLSRVKGDETGLLVSVLKQTQGVAGVAVELRLDGPAAIVRNEPAPETRAKADSLYGGEE